MRKIGPYITAGIFILVAFSCGPMAVGGNVVIDYTVSGSGTQSGTIDTGLDWNVIYNNPTLTYGWTLATPISIDLDPNPLVENIATIDGLSIGVKADPVIDFGFSARSANGETHFAFSSASLIINPALAAGAQASARATVITDEDDYVVSGDFGNKVYRSVYNGGTVFKDLVSAPVYEYAKEIAPSQLIPYQVSSMQAQWGFILSAGGEASGTSHFEIMGDVVPEPASVLLLGLGAFALLRKRRA